MANNIVSNNNSNTNGNSLRDFLQSQTTVKNSPNNSNPYDVLIELIRGLDLQDDSILMNYKIKTIETEFCNIVRTEKMLCESMEYINDKALEDGDIALKFALLFSSRYFDSLAMMETKVRSAMLNLLETNFKNAEIFRIHDKDRLYNSITLLGEYYHRLRLADNSPFKILGSSLLELLIREIRDQNSVITVKLAKLILSQITLNGDILRGKHQTELTELLYHIRRNLIEQPTLKSAEKALLIMTLDLYYSNFANLGVELEEMYTQYLVQEHEENNDNNNVHTSIEQLPELIQQELFQTESPLISKQSCNQHVGNYPTSPYENEKSNLYPETLNLNSENGVSEEAQEANGSFEMNNRSTSPVTCTKKWSEEVSEDFMLENELVEGENNLTKSFNDSQFENTASSNNAQHRKQNKSSRRSYQPKRSPRPLNKGARKSDISASPQAHNDQLPVTEGRDESKPLPRWRAPRFNRESTEERQYNDGRRRQSNQQRRFSGSYEDDQHSIRSEGGSIRLYSINDRLKHAQDKIEQSNRYHYNNIANSNWDHQSQRDDRSERSYISNYERGNHNRRKGHGNGRLQKNRQSIDKPPRFQKFHNHQNYETNTGKNYIIHSESWRRSDANYDHNNKESSNDENIRAQTLPRHVKVNVNGHILNSYRRSQSPTQANINGVNYNSRSRYYHTRWSSQGSLASEASSTLDRNKHRQRNENFSRKIYDESELIKIDWQPKETNSEELVRNAQQTTNYMNYLSSK